MHSLKDPRCNPTHPAWYGPPIQPLSADMVRHIWFINQPPDEQKRLIAEDEKLREKAEADRIKAAQVTEKNRRKTDKVNP